MLLRLLCVTGGGPAPWLQTLHGAVNSLSWGILMPIGALAARHMRDLELGELWYTTHRLVQSVAYSLGAFGFFLGILMWGQSHEGRTRRAGYGGGDEGEYDVSLHRSLGITIFVLASFQVCWHLVCATLFSLSCPAWVWGIAAVAFPECPLLLGGGCCSHQVFLLATDGGSLSLGTSRGWAVSCNGS